MVKTKLTKAQTLAVIVTNYQELAKVFAVLPKLKRIEDDSERRQRILEDLQYLIKQGFKHNMDNTSIYSVFKAEMGA